MASTELQKVVEVSGVAIHGDDDKLVSLTDIWKALGEDPNKKPAEWLRSKAAMEFIASLAKNLKVGIPTLTKSRRGKDIGGTWAHWQLALAYTKWASPEFHQRVNAAFVQWAQEEAHPELKLDRGVEKLKRKGWDDAKIRARLDGKLERDRLTSTMRDHNCKVIGRDNPYREAGTSVNLAVLGKTANEFKKDAGLPIKAKTRDHLSATQLTMVALVESSSADLIKKRAADGNAACVGAVRDVCAPIARLREELAALA